MSDVTLADIRILKEEAEQKILDVIRDFEKASDVNIDYIGLDKEESIGGSRRIMGLTITCFPI